MVHNPQEVFKVVIDKLNVFLRNKVPKEKKMKAVYLWLLGLSLFNTAKLLNVSKTSVWRWKKKIQEAIHRINEQVKRKKRKIILVDETVLKLKGKHIYIWAAMDSETREILGLEASFTRNEWDAVRIFNDVLKKCKGKPKLILVDGGKWYKKAAKRRGLRIKVVRNGRRNLVERWFRTLKDRTRVFCNNINGSFQRLRDFLDLFMAWYNFFRIHQGFGTTLVEVVLW